MKRLEKIESAIQGIANPRTVIRVIGDAPAPEDSDSTLIIRRALIEPKSIASEVFRGLFPQNPFVSAVF